MSRALRLLLPAAAVALVAGGVGGARVASPLPVLQLRDLPSAHWKSFRTDVGGRCGLGSPRPAAVARSREFYVNEFVTSGSNTARYAAAAQARKAFVARRSVQALACLELRLRAAFRAHGTSVHDVFVAPLRFAPLGDASAATSLVARVRRGGKSFKLYEDVVLVRSNDALVLLLFTGSPVRFPVRAEERAAARILGRFER